MTVGYYILIFLFGLVLLVWGSSLFVDSAVSVAGRLHLPEVLIGATIVSLGTTLPEVLFSTMASVRHLPEMAIGNALGSILCNTGFIAGMMLVLRPIYLNGKAVANVVSGTVFLGLSFAVYVAGAVMEQGLSRATGGMLLLVCILFLAYNVRNAYSRQQEEKEMHAQEQAFGISDIIRLALEAVVIYIGASMLVEVGPKLARAFGVPEMIISLIFVALGTSLPELVTSLMALRKKHASLSMGNIIGADILNFAFSRELQHAINAIIYKMCSAHGNMYGVIKEILKKNENLELGGVRKPLPSLIDSDMPIVEEAARMICEAKDKYLA